jgi:hypothetical protein
MEKGKLIYPMVINFLMEVIGEDILYNILFFSKIAEDNSFLEETMFKNE